MRWKIGLPKTTATNSVIAGLASALVLMVMGSVPNDVQANTAHCSFELDDKRRDACFQSKPEQQQVQRSPGWPILKFRSYATGNPNASALRPAEGLVMCGDTESTTSIGLHCTDEGMKVVITMGCSFDKPNALTTLQLNAGIQTSQWRAKIFDNQLGLSIEDPLDAHKFMKAMQGNDKIGVVFEPKDAAKFAATFSLKDFDKAVSHIESICAS